MPHTPPTPLFPSQQGIPPYLAVWRQTFARLAPGKSVPLELWFDRGPYPPLVETVRIPHPAAPGDQRLIELYLAVVINNVLCTQGAKRVSILAAPEADTAVCEILAALNRIFHLHLDSFSNMSLHFLHGLVQQVFDAEFLLDTDRDHAQALRELLRQTVVRPEAPRRRVRPGTVLAVNIGQHLTSLALVTIDAAGNMAIKELSRRDTWPPESRQCLTAVWENLLAQARLSIEQTRQHIDAVGISIAATVTGGTVQPVPQFGLFANCTQEEIQAADTVLRQSIAALLPGRPLTLVNDGEAQALFAFHHTTPAQQAKGADGATPGDMLSVRLGACPAIHLLDASGRAGAGFHEYGWLITRYAPRTDQDSLFATTRFYLSHYGVAMVAYELGLLKKYWLHHEAAIPFFHDALVAGDAPASQDARRVYGVLGAHLAMLAEELNRTRSLGRVTLLGSRSNRLDAAAFTAMAEGFAGFSRGQGLSVGGVHLDLLEDTSSIAGLVGAAHAALDSAPRSEAP